LNGRRSAPGDWNALHGDLYGDLVFPLQVVFGLDEPNVDYTGGEFVVVEQRPRAQSRATAAVIPKGHGLVLSTATGRSGRAGAGRALRSAMGSVLFVQADATPWASSSTTRPDRYCWHDGDRAAER
jgi:uncharacterized protein